MAGRIAKLLKRQTPERPELVEALASLAHLAEAQPDLRQAAVLQSALMQAVYAAPSVISLCPLTTEEAATRLAGGKPLLHNTPVPCTERHLRAVFLRLCTAAQTVEAKAASATLYSVIAEAVSKARLDLWACGNRLLAGEAHMLSKQLAAQGYPTDLMLTLLMPLTTPQLLVEEVALLHLGLLAQQQGYMLPT